MNSFILLLGFFIFYIIKGIVWIIIDVYWFKTSYWNVITTLANILLWPLFSFIRTFNLIKNYINKK
jgi:hypothetical protein